MFEELITAQYVHLGLSAASCSEVLTIMAKEMCIGGRVRESFLEAVLARERLYPTGLAVGCGVAIPHADAKHVIRDTISIAVFEKPVLFGDMGGEMEKIPVHVVFMLAMSENGKHLEMLTSLVKAIQNQLFLEQILAVETPDGLIDLAYSSL